MSPTHAFILIATQHLYREHACQLIRDLRTYTRFYTNPIFEPQIICCTDQISHFTLRRESTLRQGVDYCLITHEPWPLVTLHRYRTICEAAGLLRRSVKYVYYLDADLRVVAPLLPEDMEHPLIGVAHPGWFRHPRIPYGTPEYRRDHAFFYDPYTYRQYGIPYLASGVQGGEVDTYLDICKLLRDMIASEEQAGRIPLWHDESAWNWVVRDRLRFDLHTHILDPSYCYCPAHPHPDATPRIVANPEPRPHHPPKPLLKPKPKV